MKTRIALLLGSLLLTTVPASAEQIKLAAEEGIMTGVSGGCTFGIAMEMAKKAAPGSTILCMLPDTGERYLSTPLFESIESEMTEDEIALMKSTPGYHMPD